MSAAIPPDVLAKAEKALSASAYPGMPVNRIRFRQVSRLLRIAVTARAALVEAVEAGVSAPGFLEILQWAEGSAHDVVEELRRETEGAAG